MILAIPLIINFLLYFLIQFILLGYKILIQYADQLIFVFDIDNRWLWHLTVYIDIQQIKIIENRLIFRQIWHFELPTFCQTILTHIFDIYLFHFR